MKFGIILMGPASDLKVRAMKLNPNIPIIVIDNNTYNDLDISAVFVFKPFRNQADEFNKKRINEGLSPFAVMEVPLGKAKQLVKNSIRSRIVDILKNGEEYGYNIYKKYKAQYGNVSMRLIYYHLSKGLKDGLFELGETEQVNGDFSWGVTAKRKYYKLKKSL